jgi:hypothetical protein
MGGASMLSGDPVDTAERRMLAERLIRRTDGLDEDEKIDEYRERIKRDFFNEAIPINEAHRENLDKVLRDISLTDQEKTMKCSELEEIRSRNILEAQAATKYTVNET